MENTENTVLALQKPCVIYVRVSSDEQSEGFSIPAQIELLVGYARKNNLRIVRIFEEAQSAKDSGRAEFGRMLKYLNTHPEVNVILVEKTDRLYRNFKDYAIVDDNKYEIHLVKENEILSKDSTSHQKLVHGLKVLLAKNFIDNLREETYKGRKKKAEEGYIVGVTPYAYKKKDKMTTYIVEEEAVYVRKAFEYYAEGSSLAKVRLRLAREGITYRPTQPIISRGHLYKILANVTYTGRVEFEGQIYEGKFEPIIDEDLFNKVQVLLRKEREFVHDYMFIGLMKCERCGCSITGEVQQMKYLYYHCTGGARKCPQRRIHLSEQYVYNAYSRAINKIRVDEMDISWIQRCLSNELKGIRFVNTEEKDTLETQIAMIKSNMSTLYDDKLKGIITPEFWAQKNGEMENELKVLQLRLEGLSGTSKGSVEDCMKFVYMVDKLPEMFSKGGFEIRKRIAKLVFSRVTLKGRILKFTYALPFKYFVKDEVPSRNKREKAAKKTAKKVKKKG